MYLSFLATPLQFENIDAIGNVAASESPAGAPVYLRDLVEISRDYQSPAEYLNYYTWEDPKGQWQRSRLFSSIGSGGQLRFASGGVTAKTSDTR